MSYEKFGRAVLSGLGNSIILTGIWGMWRQNIMKPEYVERQKTFKNKFIIDHWNSDYILFSTANFLVFDDDTKSTHVETTKHLFRVKTIVDGKMNE